MSNMIVTGIHRTGTAASPIRQLVISQGKSTRTLGTVIEKIEWGFEFRFGGRAVPMEQYAFRVGNKVVERFADATALVLKKHHVEMDPTVPVEELQNYVRKAFAIVAGKDSLRTLSEVPETARPAVEITQAQN